MKRDRRYRLGADLRLARLALTRCLPLGFWLPFLGLLGFTLFDAGASPSLDLDQEDWVGRALMRQSAWVLLACLGAPFLIVRSAGLAQAWRRQDADWFAVLPVQRWRWGLSCALGLVAASLLLGASTALVTELAIRGDAPCSRFERTLAHGGFSLVEGDPARSWVQEDLRAEQLPRGSRLVFRPSVLRGAGPSVELGFQVLPGEARLEERGERERVAEVRALVSGPARVPVLPPEGAEGPLRLVVRRVAGDAPAMLPSDHVDLISPLDSERWISVELALWALVLSLSWSVLAAGLGAWMRPALAAGICLVCPMAALWGATGLELLPGAQLPLAWSRLGHGWAPGALAPSCLLLAGGMLGLGLGLLNRGIGRGRQLT